MTGWLLNFKAGFVSRTKWPGPAMIFPAMIFPAMIFPAMIFPAKWFAEDQSPGLNKFRETTFTKVDT
jgi:hypothetical protein